MEFQFNSNENCAKMQAQLNNTEPLLPSILFVLLKLAKDLKGEEYKKELMGELFRILNAVNKDNFYSSDVYNKFLSEQIDNLLKNSGINRKNP